MASTSSNMNESTTTSTVAKSAASSSPLTKLKPSRISVDANKQSSETSPISGDKDHHDDDPESLLSPQPQKQQPQDSTRSSTSHQKKQRNRSESIEQQQQQQQQQQQNHEPIFASRDTADFKWQRSKQVIGALEVDSEPVFYPHHDLKPRYKHGCEEIFHEALQAWQDLKLRRSFVKACDDLPNELCCCGLLTDGDETKKQYIHKLNDGWVKSTNKLLVGRGLKVDTFLWNWQNASGKAETNIVLIRFFTLSTFKFRRASTQGSLDLNDILADESISVTNYNDEDDPQQNMNNVKKNGKHVVSNGNSSKNKTAVISTLPKLEQVQRFGGVEKQEMAR